MENMYLYHSLCYLLGLLTVDPSKRLTIKDLSRNAWLRGSSVPTTHDHLMTPSILCQASRSLIVWNSETEKSLIICILFCNKGSCCQCNNACISKSRSISISFCYRWTFSTTSLYKKVDWFMFINIKFDNNICYSCCT